MSDRALPMEDLRIAAQAYADQPGPARLAELRELRWQVLEFVQRSPPAELAAAWAGGLRSAQAAVRACGLLQCVREPREEERLAQLGAGLAAGWEDAGAAACAVGAMLLAFAHELSLPPGLVDAPEWLMPDLAGFLLERPPMFMREGEAQAYVEHLERAVALIHREVGERRDAAARRLAGAFAAGANFIQAYFTGRNLRELYRMRGDLLARLLAWEGYRTARAFPRHALPRPRLRLGVLAAHYGYQSETFFTVANIDYLDRERFEVILYAEIETGQEIEQHAISLCEKFVVLPQDPQRAAQTIRDDDLDLLLIGSNVTLYANGIVRLAAHRLARVQTAIESSPTTSGLHEIDAVISAQWNNPAPQAAAHYTEALYRMPESLNVYAYQYVTQEVSVARTREGIGIGRDRVVFCSGANYYKIIPELFAAWARILARVPGSVLMLMPFGPNWALRYLERPFLDRLAAQLAAAGVSPDRLKILPAVPARADVQASVALADIYLDSYPFAGACSLVDAIDTGVPPVVWRGETARSNHGASILRQLGMTETVADSAESYADIAVRLAQDGPWRKGLARRLKEIAARETPPHRDTQSLSARVGQALQDLYARYDRFYAGLARLDAEALAARVAALVGEAGVPAALNDLALVHDLIAPYFRARGEGQDGAGRMLDVGACVGQMAAPFLDMGWKVDLFEPDPDARAVLEQNVAHYGAAARVVPAAVSRGDAPTVRFHKSGTPGLSGISPSPYGTTQAVLEVPCLRLDAWCREQGIDRVDFLKVDAEGHDFDALESMDFARLAPRIVLFEFGTIYPGQSIEDLNRVLAAMRRRGYRSLTIVGEDAGNFARGIWHYDVVRIVFDANLPADSGRVFGNALLFRQDDLDFLLALHYLFDCARPRRAFLEYGTDG